MSDVAEKNDATTYNTIEPANLRQSLWGDQQLVSISDSEAECKHDQLDVQAKIITMEDRGLKVETNVRFLDVTCKCRNCGMDMRFRGTPYGVPCKPGDEKWSPVLRAPFVGEKQEAIDAAFQVLTSDAFGNVAKAAPRIVDVPLAKLTELSGSLDRVFLPVFLAEYEDALGAGARAAAIAMDTQKKKEALIENLFSLQPYLEKPVSEMYLMAREDLKALTDCEPPILRVVDDEVQRIPEGWAHWFGDTPSGLE